jgi:hypothetical protein
MLNIGIERTVLCVEKITPFFTFLSYCFLIAAESEMKFEMPSEMENGTAQSCRSEKRIEEM